MSLDELLVGGDVVARFLDERGDRGTCADVLEEGDGGLGHGAGIEAFHAPPGGTSRLAPPRMHLAPPAGSSGRSYSPARHFKLLSEADFLCTGTIFGGPNKPHHARRARAARMFGCTRARPGYPIRRDIGGKVVEMHASAHRLKLDRRSTGVKCPAPFPAAWPTRVPRHGAGMIGPHLAADAAPARRG